MLRCIRTGNARSAPRNPSGRSYPLFFSAADGNIAVTMTRRPRAVSVPVRHVFDEPLACLCLLKTSEMSM